MDRRRIPIGAEFLDVADDYLQTRNTRSPSNRRRASSDDRLNKFPYRSPVHGNRRLAHHPSNPEIPHPVRLQEGRYQRRRPSGALVHELRHTFATENR